MDTDGYENWGLNLLRKCIHMAKFHMQLVDILKIMLEIH